MRPEVGFNCTRCGLCCRDVDKVPQTAHFDRGDGTCIHLVELVGDPGSQPEYSCAIYEDRPEVCRVDFGRPEAVSPEWWYRQTEAACRVLQENDKMKRRLPVL